MKSQSAQETAAAQPRVVGERVLRVLDAVLSRLDRWVASAIPESLNPLAQTGAVANVALIIAIVTGALLLFWYDPSVTSAYSSTEGMSDSWLAHPMRSLHRYSSDAAILFVLLHTLQILGSRRVGGARWVAWVTGISLLFLLWFVGWLGYWLVWDERAQQVAIGTAKLADALPIFVEPLSRSFLTDGSVNSLLFFLVFFGHMLLPLGMGIALWLHITRTNRSRFLTKLPLGLWVTGTLLVLSLVIPATSVGEAEMARIPQGFTMDWWYLLPLTLTDRLGSGALWAVFAVSMGAFLATPWLVVRRGRDRKRRAIVAEVSVPSCNSCERCHNDCPYGAITMVPRTDGRDFPAQAEVNPARCVGCGICAGSCDSASVGIPWLDAARERRRIDEWLARPEPDESPPAIAFVCAESAAASLQIDTDSGECEELPGYRAIAVPCIGWVHMLSVERAVKKGSPGVLLIGCRSEHCAYREGTTWTEARLSGERGPSLRKDKVDPDKIEFIQIDRGKKSELIASARRFRESLSRQPAGPISRGRTMVGGLALVVGTLAVTYLPSELSYRTGLSDEPQLVVSFRHPGQVQESCRELSEEELAERPAHLRRKTECGRTRAPVRMRVLVDGETVVDGSYNPHGLASDGNSTALERIPVEPGEHRVSIQLGDTADVNEWGYADEKNVMFEPGRRRVVLFDRLSLFSWH